SHYIYYSITYFVATILSVFFFNAPSTTQIYTFPTRRSSDLFTVGSRWPVEDEGLAGMILATGGPATKQDYTTMPGPLGAALRDRSEEHTSELQSLAYLVCRLLLEKKKNKQHNNTARNITYKT